MIPPQPTSHQVFRNLVFPENIIQIPYHEISFIFPTISGRRGRSEAFGYIILQLHMPHIAPIGDRIH